LDRRVQDGNFLNRAVDDVVSLQELGLAVADGVSNSFSKKDWVSENCLRLATTSTFPIPLGCTIAVEARSGITYHLDARAADSEERVIPFVVSDRSLVSKTKMKTVSPARSVKFGVTPSGTVKGVKDNSITRSLGFYGRRVALHAAEGISCCALSERSLEKVLVLALALPDGLAKTGAARGAIRSVAAVCIVTVEMYHFNWRERK
jgi:hypothetical protein